MRYTYNKKAEIMLTGMLVFFLVILVAAVSSLVLVSNDVSTSEQKSNEGPSSVMLYALDGSDGTIEDFRQKIKMPESTDSSIEFNDAVLELASDNIYAKYIYSDESCTFDQKNGIGDGYYVNQKDNKGTYTVKYLVKGLNYKKGFLSAGDVVALCYRSPVSLGEDVELDINFIPRYGVPLNIETSSPKIINDKRIYIFP